MTVDDVTSALAPLPTPYHHHFSRIRGAVAADPRIRGLWLSGSLARRTADAGSDLDLVLTVDDEHHDAFVDGWRGWLDGLLPVLLAKDIPRSRLIFYALTDDMCRVDGVVESVSQLAESPHRTRIPVLDRDGLVNRLPAPQERPGPDGERITAMIEEFWRIESIFPAILDGRGDLLCAQVGVHAAQQILYNVFVESNQPMPAMGVKQFSSRLTADQIAALQELPPVVPERSSLITAHRAVCAAMSVHGRAAADKVGARYPNELAAAVVRHQASLGPSA